MPTLACLVGKLVSSTATRRLLGRQRAQPRGAHGQPRNPRAALEVGRVVRDRHADARAGGVALLERDHAAEQAPVELGDRDLGGGVERREARVGLLPGGARGRRADGLDHGHAEVGERGGVPLLPGLPHAVAALGHDGVARARAARRQHRHDERVDVAREQLERRDAPIGIAAQRVAPDGHGIAAGLLDGARTAHRRTPCCPSGGASGRSRRRRSDGRDRGLRAPGRAGRRRSRARRRRGRAPRAAARSRSPRAGTCRPGSAATARRCRCRRGAGTRPPARRRRRAPARAPSSRRPAAPRRPGRAARCRARRSARAAGRSPRASRAGRRARGRARRARPARTSSTNAP